MADQAAISDYVDILMESTTPSQDYSETDELYHLGNARRYMWLQPVLAALLSAAIMYGVVGVIRVFSPDGPWQYLALFAALAALEGALTTIWLRHPDRRMISTNHYRASEMVLIALMARLLTWDLGAELPVLTDWQLYLKEPVLLLTGGFFTYAILGIIAWWSAVAMTETLTALAMGQDEAEFYQTAWERGLQINDNPFKQDRMIHLNQFLRQWFVGGGVLCLCAAALSFDISQPPGDLRMLVRLNLPGSMLLTLIAYFLIGLWLLGQARLALQYARWVASRTGADRRVLDSWHRASLGIVAGIALLATLLPIGSTNTLSRIISAAASLFVNLAHIIGIIFLTLVTLLLSILPTPGAREEAESQLEALAAQPLGQQSAANSEVVDLISGGMFWALVGALIVAAIIFLLRENRFQIDRALLAQLWRDFWIALRELWLSLRGMTKEVVQAVVSRVQTAQLRPPNPQSLFGYVRVNSLPPRQQIRFLYQSLLRRAGEQGVERPPAATPLEFAGDMKAAWPEVGQGIDDMTEGFLRARYSPAEIEREDLPAYKAAWRQLRGWLRRHNPYESESADQ